MTIDDFVDGQNIKGMVAGDQQVYYAVSALGVMELNNLYRSGMFPATAIADSCRKDGKITAVKYKLGGS